jgi:hypothetical protein
MIENNISVAGKRPLEKITGLIILIIAFLAVSAILTDLDVSPEYMSIREDMTYLGENFFRLTVNTYLWFLNAILIILLGPILFIVFPPSRNAALYAGTFMICSTGIIYLFYAINGFNLLQYTRDFQKETGEATDFLAYFSLNSIIIRQKLHLSAFTTSGISTFLIGIHVIKSRHLPVFIGWFVLFGGLIYAIFGWFSMQNLIFSTGRLVFILSLILFGSFLLLSGIKTRTPA